MQSCCTTSNDRGGTSASMSPVRSLEICGLSLASLERTRVEIEREHTTIWADAFAHPAGYRAQSGSNLQTGHAGTQPEPLEEASALRIERLLERPESQRLL